MVIDVICLVRKNIRYGGAELLLERMARYLKDSGKDCIVLCNNISKEMEKRLNDVEIEIQIEKRWMTIETIRRLQSRGELLFITTWVHDYLVLDILRKTKTVEFDMLHYIVAADDLCLGKSIPSRYLYSMFHKYYTKKIGELDKTGAIIYMDTESINKTEKFYDFDNKPHVIVRLPYDVSTIDAKELERREKKRKKSFNILTISRSEFPMKGYLIELIKNFKTFNEKYPNSKLIIVSFGEGQARIDEEFEKLPLNVQENVIIYGQMSLKELNSVWDEASVYVGLGTSVLDAANRGICAIPALQYSMTFRASHFFFEKPGQISSDIDAKANGYKFIEQIYNMGAEEYINSCIECHDKLVEYYDLKNAMDKLLALSKGKNQAINWKMRDWFIERAFLKYDDIRYQKRQKDK